jgi:maltose O-acetyltransferase
MIESQEAIKILFDWQNLSFEDLKKIVIAMNIKNIRWLAIHHPDNRTRENLYRLSNVSVGAKTVINMGLYIYDSFKPLVTIGANCALAANISLIPESGPNMSELSNVKEIAERLIVTAPIVIEDHSWIGSNVIVMPGVTIGHHSIIGAGAIITKDVIPFSIIKGNIKNLSRTIRLE